MIVSLLIKALGDSFLSCCEGMMRKDSIINKYLLVGGLGAILSLQVSCSRSFVWSDQVDTATIADSWKTYAEFFSSANSILLTKEQFICQLRKGTYTQMSISHFLSLPIENHRLARYHSARTAEEAYPESDRPRQSRDIDSVNYFLSSLGPVSPITVAIMMDKKGKIRFIKLDGVHRMMAANILQQDLRVLWIDLRRVEHPKLPSIF